MRTAILLNRSNAGLRRLGKQVLTGAYQAAFGGGLGQVVLPEFDSFAGLLHSNPIMVGTGDEVDWSALASAELLIWEWGWTSVPARRMLEIKQRLKIPVLMFPGPLDRFWRELAPEDINLQFEAAAATDAIGVMLEDTATFYQSLVPLAHVFHLPVPLDIPAFRAAACLDRDRDRDLLLLTAPTRFTGSASQLPITTFVAFRQLVAHRPKLRGLCFVYDDEERAVAERALSALGLVGRVEVRSYLRPIQRYLRMVARCWAGLSLPHGVLQGRNAMTSACLGLPLVVSEEIETHRRLYPETSVRWHDTQAAVDRTLKLLEDDAFRTKVVENAFDAVQFYAVDRCRTRLESGIAATIAKSRLRGGA